MPGRPPPPFLLPQITCLGNGSQTLLQFSLQNKHVSTHIFLTLRYSWNMYFNLKIFEHRCFRPISVSGWDWWRSACWLCSWTSAFLSGTPSAPSSLPSLSPALWLPIGASEGSDKIGEEKEEEGMKFNNFAETQNLKSCLNLLCNNWSLQVLIYSHCQSCQRKICFIFCQTLHQRNFHLRLLLLPPILPWLQCHHSLCRLSFLDMIDNHIEFVLQEW